PGAAAHEQIGSCATDSRRSCTPSLRATLPRAHRALTMADRISENLQEKISARLRFYQDIGIDLFYRNRAVSAESPLRNFSLGEGEAAPSDSIPVAAEHTETVETVIAANSFAEKTSVFEDTVPRTPRKPVLPPAPALQVPAPPKVVLPAPKSGLFDASE